MKGTKGKEGTPSPNSHLWLRRWVWLYVVVSHTEYIAAHSSLQFLRARASYSAY